MRSQVTELETRLKSSNLKYRNTEAKLMSREKENNLLKQNNGVLNNDDVERQKRHLEADKEVLEIEKKYFKR